MDEVLRCGQAKLRVFLWDRLTKAIEESLALGCTDAAAVRHLVTANELVRSRPESVALSGLERYDRPLPQMREYDLLLGPSATVGTCSPKSAHS